MCLDRLLGGGVKGKVGVEGRGGRGRGKRE